ncbi:hypothetical protein [Candidatus Bathycorpusculum sp.]|jgi:hypothetical protein|uniref:hypothetical protein n=1 Tax=Candidatus Bathycorpusculum sp. TaxID=2994959 RepID=UPI00282AC5F9|nr:hypothetical protein [Candidatus Termitimicrobium sp.]MCL2686031.1 hypothetical protein [Candidatus Termitimicrobium sp.]
MYYPDGKITVWESERSVFYTVVKGNARTVVNSSARIAEVEPLNAVLDRNPFGTYDVAAQTFETYITTQLQPIENQSVTSFTTDCALFWWDLQGGYDFVLAELGGNSNIAQEIGLVRGAANLQGKSWGTTFTWKHTQ